MKILLVVAAAIINESGEILLAQRPQGKQLAGSWEFPGGKIEADESPEAALVRELKEELGIEVSQKDLEPFWFLSHPYPQFEFHLMMPVYCVKKWRGEAVALEHAALRWSKPEDMQALNMIEADTPLVEKLKAALTL